jgi:hypothetical protein
MAIKGPLDLLTLLFGRRLVVVKDEAGITRA